MLYQQGRTNTRRRTERKVVASHVEFNIQQYYYVDFAILFLLMTARDYQHKRFRSPGPKEGVPQNSSPRAVTPARDELVPRRIQVEEEGENNAPKSNKQDFIHKPNKDGLDSTSSPQRPTESLRYPLTTGIDNDRKGVNEGRVAAQLKAANALALQSTGESKSKEKRRSSRHKHDPNSYKIFLLLLQPESKIFELIQLMYMPNDTTVGNIIEMIPDNATEDSLGSQEYIGLCRPKTQEEIVNKDILASNTSSGAESARITLGEILVAIPKGYSTSDVAALSKQILANPKIIKLLKRADPLAPKRRRSSKRRSHRGSRSRSRENVHVLEQHDETEEIQEEEESERMMKKAMEQAAKKAAAANAEVPGEDLYIPIQQQQSNSSDNGSMQSSLQDSVDESYSSWSKSFDASFSVQSKSPIGSPVAKRQVRRKVRQARRLRVIKRAAVVGFCLMIALYMLDPQGYSAESNFDHKTNTPMGLLGLFQVLFLLAVLYKTEKLVRATTEGHTGEVRCPFLKASDKAMRKFKEKYAKKLEQHKNAYHDDGISRRLQASTFQEMNIPDNASL